MHSALDRLDSLRRSLLLHRRLIGGLCAAAAVLLVVELAAAPAPATEQVWTAARAVPAGAVLERADLTSTGYAPGTAPAGRVRDPSVVIGRTLALPLHRGEAVLPSHLVGPGLLTGRPGTIALPVRVSDPDVVALLHVGDQVDLLAADPQHPERRPTVVSDAAVLALPRSSSRQSLSPLPGRLVLVAVPRSARDTLALSGVAEFVTVLWDR